MTGRAPTSTSTNENSGKIYADWKPMSWFGIRSSGYVCRRGATTTTITWIIVGNIQFPGTTVAGNSFYL